MKPIDFRSDTVTKPSQEMRAAMVDADVGDDVLERDPTMERLEHSVAELLGHEAALWVPSGCMSNLIGLMIHLKRGDRFLAPALSHVLDSELGTAAWLAQGMPEALPWEGGLGRITPKQIADNLGGAAYYSLKTSLV
jgi:threonine aldolase